MFGSCSAFQIAKIPRGVSWRGRLLWWRQAGRCCGVGWGLGWPVWGHGWLPPPLSPFQSRGLDKSLGFPSFPFPGSVMGDLGGLGFVKTSGTWVLTLGNQTKPRLNPNPDPQTTEPCVARMRLCVFISSLVFPLYPIISTSGRWISPPKCHLRGSFACSRLSNSCPLQKPFQRWSPGWAGLDFKPQSQYFWVWTTSDWEGFWARPISPCSTEKSQGILLTPRKSSHKFLRCADSPSLNVFRNRLKQCCWSIFFLYIICK